MILVRIRFNCNSPCPALAPNWILQVVEDGVSGAVDDQRGLQQIYRVLWKVPRPQGRAPAEVAAEGRGSTVAEAQATAAEDRPITIHNISLAAGL